MKYMIILYISIYQCILLSQTQDEFLDPKNIVDTKPKWPTVLNSIDDEHNLEIINYLNDSSEVIVDGYRVQIFVTRYTSSADSIRNSLAKKIEEEIFVTFEIPYYKVRVGNCIDRKTAEKLQKKLQSQGFPSSWIVRARVKAPEIMREF